MKFKQSVGQNQRIERNSTTSGINPGGGRSGWSSYKRWISWSEAGIYEM